jgi:hypothetical protein
MFSFFLYVIQHCFIICRHSDSTVLEDAGIELRTVASCDFDIDSQALDLIHDLARSHPQTRLDLIHPPFPAGVAYETLARRAWPIPLSSTLQSLSFKGGFFWIFFFFMYVIQHCFLCCPSDSIMSEDARIEPRIVATLALTARRSKHSGISHPGLC